MNNKKKLCEIYLDEYGNLIIRVSFRTVTVAEVEEAMKFIRDLIPKG